jgi:hypothetical protein
VATSYASLRKKPLPAYRQRLLWGLIPVPGSEAISPPLNHHGVDLPAIRKKMELNRASIGRGKLVFPGLGVSKRPMTIVTESATYEVGWAYGRGMRSIAMVGEPPLPDGKILFLHMGEPMVFSGPGDIVCTTPPVIFIGRRHYHEIGLTELRVGG